MLMTGMKNIKHWLLRLSLILLVHFSASEVYAQVNYDTARQDLRRFNTEELTKFKNDDQFKYRFVAEPPVSLWERFWNWFWTRLDNIVSTPSGKIVVKVLVYGLVIFFLGLFIFQLRKMNASGLFGKAKGEQVKFSISDDDINSIDFEGEIARALDGGDYRLAIRLYYLSTLKALSDRSLIDWQIDKTNISYVQELRSNSLTGRFRELTAYFENHWYGNLAISRDEFAAVRNSFETFNRELKA
jgi:hypothetical protein